MVEEEADFWDGVVAGDDERAEQVVDRVIEQLAQRYLFLGPVSASALALYRKLLSLTCAPVKMTVLLHCDR